MLRREYVVAAFVGVVVVSLTDKQRRIFALQHWMQNHGRNLLPITKAVMDALFSSSDDSDTDIDDDTNPHTDPDFHPAHHNLNNLLSVRTQTSPATSKTDSNTTPLQSSQTPQADHTDQSSSQI